MSEDWLEQLKNDKKEMEEKPQWKTLQIGKNVLVLDFSTKMKVVRNVNIDGQEQKRTYVMFDLIGDKIPKVSLTMYQYITLLNDIGNLDEITKEMEVIADVKVVNNKKVFTFNVTKR